MADGLHEFTREPRVAYFSMEIALRSQIGTYAGGLGVLAGDTLRSAADLSLPLVGVCPVSTIMGTESIIAVSKPVTVLVAPGPDVTSTTPGRPVARA